MVTPVIASFCFGFLFGFLDLVGAFSVGPRHVLSTRLVTHHRNLDVSFLSMASEPFEVEVNMPPSGSGLQAQMKFESVLPGESEIIEVRYKIPFGLDVAPKNGLAVCTKMGKGGEKEGDVLRFTSQWTMGLPRGDGLATTAASFAGGLSWQCSMFDCVKATRWEAVVEALTSNVDSRTDEVVLLFERPIASE